MSDALLTRIAEAVEGLRVDLKATRAAGAKEPTTTTTTTTAKPEASTAEAAAAVIAKAAKASEARAKLDAELKAKNQAKAAADAAAASKAKADAKAAAAKGPPAGTKAPGGKHTIEDVRDIIRRVASDPALGKAAAADVLTDDGGGAARVTDLKPDKYDAVYEACQVLLSSEGDTSAEPEEEPEEDLM
jgi:hypothetical protein